MSEDLQQLAKDWRRAWWEHGPFSTSFMDRPTLREWKRHMTRLRYQRRLARAPLYRLGLLLLLILASGVLIWAVWPR